MTGVWVFDFLPYFSIHRIQDHGLIKIIKKISNTEYKARPCICGIGVVARPSTFAIIQTHRSLNYLAVACIIAGTVAVQVSMSFWALTFSGSLFLSLALVKRYAELLVQKAAGRDKAKAAKSAATAKAKTATAAKRATGKKAASKTTRSGKVASGAKTASASTSAKKPAKKAAAKQASSKATSAAAGMAPAKGASKTAAARKDAAKKGAAKKGAAKSAGISPKRALANTRKLLAEQDAKAAQPKPWDGLGNDGTAQAAPGFQSPKARSRALELHAGETRQAPIHGSISTRDRKNQGKRDHRSK